MDSRFWVNAWKEGRTHFHQGKYHDKLIKYFPQLNPQKGQKVLVPLCGKTKDLVWLHSLGLHVYGVELYEQAIKDFFSENQLPLPGVSRDQDFTHYSSGNIVISCGDFFKLSQSGACDFVYDRGALVALPPPMREKYARVLKGALKTGGKYLLVAYEYDTSKMEGPPFHVSGDEIRALYQDQFSIQLVESERPKNEGARLAALESLRENVYILEKTGRN